MNLIPKLLLLLTAAALLSSCKKNDSTPDNNISWKTDGTVRSAKPEASFFDDGSFLLEAHNGGDYISLFIDSTMHTGTFRLDDPFDGAIAEYQAGKNGADQYAETGTITFTYFDGTFVIGRFEFTTSTGGVKHKITEGTFTSDVSYYDFSEQPDCPEDTMLSVMRHKRLTLKNARSTERFP